MGDGDHEQRFRWVADGRTYICGTCKFERDRMPGFLCEGGEHYVCGICLRMRARGCDLRSDGEYECARPDRELCRQFICRVCDDRAAGRTK